jgi:hypothetical protein
MTLCIAKSEAQAPLYGPCDLDDNQGLGSSLNPDTFVGVSNTWDMGRKSLLQVCDNRCKVVCQDYHQDSVVNHGDNRFYSMVSKALVKRARTSVE